MTTSVGSIQAKLKIDDEAMRWLFELNSGREPTLQQWSDFDAWLSSNPDHEEIYCRFEENLRLLMRQCALRC